jgi:hypothetical protein
VHPKSHEQAMLKTGASLVFFMTVNQMGEAIKGNCG